MNWKKAILASLAIVLLGCAGTPATQYYVLHLNPAPAASVSPLTVGIESLSIEPIFANYKIAYRETPYQIQFYHYHQWASDPARLVEDGIVDYLTSSSHFKKVVRLPSIDPVDIAVNGHIHKIEEWDEADRWYGIMEIEFQITDKRSNDLIWQGTLARKVPAEGKEPIAIVRALSAAAQEITGELTAKILAATTLAGN